jgi:hypothetical protein
VSRKQTGDSDASRSSKLTEYLLVTKNDIDTELLRSKTTTHDLATLSKDKSP